MIGRLIDAIQAARIEPGNLSCGYYYASLPLCVIDAVYSIGVRYGGVENVVHNWCESHGWQRFSEERQVGAPVQEQHSISDFLKLINGLSDDKLAGEVFQNRQRTSTRNGILKASAVREFAEALARHGVEQFGDTLDEERNAQVECDVLAIRGQSSGLSWSYFLMLAGSDEYVKPDRMLCRFVCGAMGWPVQLDLETRRRVSEVVVGAAHRMGVTPRALDHALWGFERLRWRRRSRNSRRPANCSSPARTPD